MWVHHTCTALPERGAILWTATDAGSDEEAWVSVGSAAGDEGGSAAKILVSRHATANGMTLAGWSSSALRPPLRPPCELLCVDPGSQAGAVWGVLLGRGGSICMPRRTCTSDLVFPSAPSPPSLPYSILLCRHPRDTDARRHQLKLTPSPERLLPGAVIAGTTALARRHHSTRAQLGIREALDRTRHRHPATPHPPHLFSRMTKSHILQRPQDMASS
jgi:hypothetical protein